MTADSITSWIMAYAAAFGVLFTIGEVARRKVKTWADEREARTVALIQKVLEQFDNNGGSTLRDAVDRIERRVDGIDARLLVQEQATDALEEAIAPTPKPRTRRTPK